MLPEGDPALGGASDDNGCMSRFDAVGNMLGGMSAALKGCGGALLAGTVIGASAKGIPNRIRIADSNPLSRGINTGY